MFEKREGQDWERQSFFAERIATFAPGSWFDRADSKEQDVFETGRKALERAGISDARSAVTFCKVTGGFLNSHSVASRWLDGA